MYKLPYFTESDTEKVISFMKANSFALVCSNGEYYPVATQVPLDIQMKGNSIIFTGHIMKNTDHHKAFVKNENVLVIFKGPHSYISASWYLNPKVASTWNYISVHAKGKINFVDELQTLKIIEDLTNKYEGKESTGNFNNLSKEYVDQLVKAISGFTINIENVENVFKLSQNHEIETRKKIISHLIKKGDENSKAIAKEMELRIAKPKLSK